MSTNPSKGRGGGRITRGKQSKEKAAVDLNLSSLSSDMSDIPASPNKFQLLSSSDYMCESCQIDKTDNPNMLLLNCARCKKMFCTLCTHISDVDFNVLSRSDCIWCCAGCRPKVEKIFEVDFKVEEYKEYARKLEERICNLEKEKKMTDETEQYIKDFITSELKKSTEKATPEMEVKKLVAA